MTTLEKFTTITQYDKKYQNGKYGNACSLFSLFNAYIYMTDGNYSSDAYGASLELASQVYAKLQGVKDMSFDQLLAFCDLKSSKVEATSVELINSGVVTMDHAIKPDTHDKPYCIMFLKNAKFFNLLFVPKSVSGKDKNLYCIRDCHEKEQINFTDRSAVISHLYDIYQFNKNVDLGGYKVPEFSNVEFLCVEASFALKKFQ